MSTIFRTGLMAALLTISFFPNSAQSRTSEVRFALLTSRPTALTVAQVRHCETCAQAGKGVEILIKGGAFMGSQRITITTYSKTLPIFSRDINGDGTTEILVMSAHDSSDHHGSAQVFALNAAGRFEAIRVFEGELEEAKSAPIHLELSRPWGISRVDRFHFIQPGLFATRRSWFNALDAFDCFVYERGIVRQIASFWLEDETLPTEFKGATFLKRNAPSEAERLPVRTVESRIRGKAHVVPTCLKAYREYQSQP